MACQLDERIQKKPETAIVHQIRKAMAKAERSIFRLVWVYAFIITAICIGLAGVFYLTHWFSDLWTGYIISGIIFIGVMLTVIHANGALGGSASLYQLGLTGLITAVLATIMIATVTLLFHLVTVPTDPAVLNTATEEARINEYSIQTRQGFWIFMVTNVLFANITLGVLGALIGAIAVKRNQQTENAG